MQVVAQDVVFGRGTGCQPKLMHSLHRGHVPVELNAAPLACRGDACVAPTTLTASPMDTLYRVYPPLNFAQSGRSEGQLADITP
ncbi:MAG TPA: hypothetical protein DEF43_20240 [Chloroflexus aurantiacus]|nr:MAG: hypothetical protein D6716_10110 [Chloroflexota bacterium]HBW69431.1 hypothetical protein [Chloroflexus aurantiacus]